MRQIIQSQDFTGQTFEKIEGYYQNCIFNNVILKGEIYCVWKDCTANPLTFENASIKRLHTPGTPLPNVIINKPSFQPIHLTKTLFQLFHNHQYITGKIRKYANAKLTGTTKTLVLNACTYIDNHPEMSWADFLFKAQTPKTVWHLAEKYFEDDPELLAFVLNVRSRRWPS